MGNDVGILLPFLCRQVWKLLESSGIAPDSWHLSKIDVDYMGNCFGILLPVLCRHVWKLLESPGDWGGPGQLTSVKNWRRLQWELFWNTTSGFVPPCLKTVGITWDGPGLLTSVKIWRLLHWKPCWNTTSISVLLVETCTDNSVLASDSCNTSSSGANLQSLCMFYVPTQIIYCWKRRGNSEKIAE